MSNADSDEPGVLARAPVQSARDVAHDPRPGIAEVVVAGPSPVQLDGAVGGGGLRRAREGAGVCARRSGVAPRGGQ